ncbi:hypothetical protein BpHYR1_039049, partial [Brachionus plicatilis]
VTETNEEHNSAAEINPDSYWMDPDFLDLNEGNQPENHTESGPDTSVFEPNYYLRRQVDVAKNELSGGKHEDTVRPKRSRRPDFLDILQPDRIKISFIFIFFF